MKQKNLWILCGVPGSGKSHWANIEASKNNGIVISRDKIRFEKLKDGEDYFSHEKEVFKDYITALQKAIKNNEYDNIYADATHLNFASRYKELKNLRIPQGVNVYCAYFSVPLETCLKRNAQRTGRAYVPEETIRDMKINTITIPTAEEGFNAVFMIDENGNNLGKLQNN